MKDLDRIFFGGWERLYHTAVVGGLAYVGLVILLLVSGQRTLPKISALTWS